MNRITNTKKTNTWKVSSGIPIKVALDVTIKKDNKQLVEKLFELKPHLKKGLIGERKTAKEGSNKETLKLINKCLGPYLVYLMRAVSNNDKAVAKLLLEVMQLLKKGL